MSFSNNYSQATWCFVFVMTQFLFLLSKADITILSSVVFHNDIKTFDLIIDARAAKEYASGHIENAILVSELGLRSHEVSEEQLAAAIARLSGCRSCRVAVYSSTGRKAMVAVKQLESIGNFEQLFNGLGIGEWATAGFPLVTTRPHASASRCLGATQSFCTSDSDVSPSDNGTSNNEVEQIPGKKIVPPVTNKDELKLFTEVNTQGNVRRQKRVRG